MITLRAKHVLPVSSPALEDGAVVVEYGRIAAFGPWKDFRNPEAVDLGDAVLMPGLINAHCHLDYTRLRGAILPPSSFAAWIGRINDLKRMLTDDDYLQSVNEGLEEARASGTTTILNIESYPEIFLRLQRPVLRVWWFLELLDIRSRISTEALVAGALALLDQRPGWLGGSGLSPHAPYTTSPALYRAASECAALRQIHFTTHVAETTEEFEMFTARSGRLYEFLAGLGRDSADLDGRTPFARLLEAGLLPPGAILAHMNCLSENDWTLLAEGAADFHVVHCPRCHSYFDRPEFPVERFLKAGVNVCLGTDSLASNRSLDLFAEMRHMLRKHPGLSPSQVLRMTTLSGARALGLPGRLGEIRPGAHADLIAIPAHAHAKDLEELVIESGSPSWVMVDGAVTSPPQ